MSDQQPPQLAAAHLAAVSLKPGDVVIVSHPHRLTAVAKAAIKAQIGSMFPGHRVAVVQDGLTLGVVAAAPPALMKFPGITRTSGEALGYGSDVFVDPAQVIAVDPRSHTYHSHRPAQAYSVLHLTTGGTVEVFASSDDVHRRIEKVRADAQRTQDARPVDA